jgi:hypothetical protein
VIADQIAWAAAGSALSRLMDRVRPTPMGRRLPEQTALAGALRGGASGLAGSEADWYRDEQGRSTIGWLPIVQDITSARRPVSWFVPGDPGADGQPLLARDFERRPWGPTPWGVKTTRPALLRPALLAEPTQPTPLPRTVQAGFERTRGPDAALEALWT